MKTLTSPPKIARLRREPARPTGPKFVPKIEQIVGGPGDTTPDGFLTGQNSLTEWNCYWALAKIFGEPKDPRLGPFNGGWPFWVYQKAALGAHTRAIGSAVIDFVVYQGDTVLGIRIQTEFFHIFAQSSKQVYDQLQYAELEGSGIDVVDVYDTQLLNDPSGQKYIVNMKKAINREQLLNPDISGTGLRGSRMKVLS